MDRKRLREQALARKARIEEANERVTARAGRNLVFAFGSGIALAAVFLLALFWVRELFPLLALVISCIAVYELATAFRNAGRRVPRVGVIIGSVIVILLAWFQAGEGLLLGLLAAGALLALWRFVEGLMPRFEAPWRTLIADVASGFFTLVYVPFLLGMVVVVHHYADHGDWWIFCLILIVVCVDIGAYAFGVTLGKHKMAPRISPGKTWEGFAGAALLALGAGVFSAVVLLSQSILLGLLFGAAVLVTAVAGDLTESLIKRSLNVKDMSDFIPGHGGLLDRLDSILPSIIPMYIAVMFVGAL